MTDQKKFNLWNRICAAAAFVVSAVTYLLTIEPTASFWDCGEFIASSYKLEVGHPPGNPVFQLIARIFTLFGDNMHAAVLVNAMSAICSALTIFFLYLTIVFFVRRLVKSDNIVAICGSGLVGALVYCFSDTFWFSAVEGEVYAMSSLFTAAVFWAMTKWYEQADRPHANRWIVLISFLMGLSIGVHLLNLLAIPALVFLYYYRQREDRGYSFKEYVKIFLIGVLILAVILFLIIPFLPKLAAYCDLFFVNVLHLPYNSGAAFFLIAVLALCFWGIFRTLAKGKVFLNTALLCLTTIIIGFSIFSIDIIRSAAKTPTNEYQPDNAFTLVRYLSREQYGSTPLVYGQYYDAPYEAKATKYWAPLDGKYKHVAGPPQADYRSEGKMLFPRMWSNSPDGRYEKFYENYTNGKGHYVKDAQHRKPTMGANLAYFFDYQINWMYWRYFMWNFVGRQNDICSTTPGELFYGNWESGIKFLDELRLLDQSSAPESLKGNKGKNHYFFLPLILGLLGLFFQFAKDKRGCWLVFLMFFMTGIAIVIYLNQPPYQVRERDYAYAGSFYFFSVWAGLAVAAISEWISDALNGKHSKAVAVAVSVLCLGVPALMAQQNWDDHDRSNRRTAVEMAYNYLNSVDENGILVTHGDNDTFPLWYAQEVENIRTDVRICNTSLLGTDWYIDQMTYPCNESAPLDLSLSHDQYLYGFNEYVLVSDKQGKEWPISDVMKIVSNPSAVVPLTNGEFIHYIPARNIVVPVNRENCVRCGIVPEVLYDRIPESITITIPEGKTFLSKPELFFLDLLSKYQWDRPINLLNQGGDINIGIKDYLEYCGYSFKLIPFRNTINELSVGYCDAGALYRKMTQVYKWDALSRSDYYVDYQNCYTFLGVSSVRTLFYYASNAFIAAGRPDWAAEMLDKSQSLVDSKRYPLVSQPIGFVGDDVVVMKIIDNYYQIGQDEKAEKLAKEFVAQLLESTEFYIDFYEFAQTEFNYSTQILLSVAESVKAHNPELSKQMIADLYALLPGREGDNG